MPIANNAAAPQISSDPIFNDAAYSPNAIRWHQTVPYGFIFSPRDTSKTSKIMYLPINPSNLDITTHFATNIIPTIYGTVEEHSPVRYYDITIQGTTGIGPKYVQPVDYGAYVTPLLGRSSFTIKQNISLGGFFSQTISTISNIANSSLSNSKTSSTGLQLDQTGYAAFHNLYRFLLAYKKDITESASTNNANSSTPPDAPLIFFNRKDSNQYAVVVRSFSLKRDKENPMLYYYSIVMRGYDLDAIDAALKRNNDQDLLTNLGLNGINGNSFLGNIMSGAANAKSILSSVGNGVSQLGR